MLNLNAVVSKLDKSLGHLINENVEIQTKLISNLWEVNIDPLLIEQVIVRLISNAVNAMPERGKVVIETANVVIGQNHSTDPMSLLPGKYILLTLYAPDLGLADEDKKYIFDHSFATKESEEDIGLDLAAVFRIVKQNGGYIDIVCELGGGTEFRIYLPKFADTVVVVNHPLRQANLILTGTETVLLVEDEAKIRDMGGRLLRRQGYTVLTAADGEEALQVSQQHTGKIHLLLTDLVMPGINGKVLAERFRVLHPDIKILFTSGYTDKTIIQQDDLDANTAFIQKPFAVGDFLSKVRSVLDS